MSELCKETGTVRAVKRDCAEVEVERTHDCGSCKACIFSRSGSLTVLARNPIGAKAGERVELAMNKSSGMSMLATVIGLGIPLILLIASVIVCSVVNLPEWVNLIVSVCALAIGFLIVWLVDKFARKTRMCAEITSVLTLNSDESDRVKLQSTGE